MNSNYTNQDSYTQPIEFKQKLEKRQAKTLTFSLLWSALGFIAVGLLTFIFVYVIKNNFNYITSSNAYIISSSVISIVLLIVGIILDIKIRANLINASWGLIIGVWFIYVFIYTGILAPLITMIDDPYVIALSLGLTGMSLVICAIISTTMMTEKASYTINKIIWIGFSVMFFIQMIFMFTWIFVYANFQVWQAIYSGAFAILSFLILLQNMYAIRRNSIFVDQQDNATITKISFYFGYIIMCSVINLFIMLLRLISSIRK